jgi:ABC-type multidrug transport system ATPase subunit
VRLELQNIGKRFNRDWIFRGVNLLLESGDKICLIGANGSGKSTLMRVMCGYMDTNEGVLCIANGDTTISLDQLYKHISIAAPYLDLPEDLTLEEAFAFHQKFKPFASSIDVTKMVDLLQIDHRNKAISLYSSGMKQRVKLAFAILSEVPLVFLDEPCTNLDDQGIQWYLELINKYASDKILVVCSNRREEEAPFADRLVNILDYKKKA